MDKSVYTSYRNQLTKLVRAMKKQYFEEFFNSNRKNGGAVWKMINSTIGGNKNAEQLVSDVSELNDFFVNLGPSTVSQLPKSSSSDYLKKMKYNVHSFVLNQTNHAEVLLAGLSLSDKNSFGFDDISPKFLKSILHLVLIPLTHVFNLSFQFGVVPTKLKIAKIVPVYKSGNKSLPVNYRPISLLSSFSKILEKLVYERLISFIGKYNLLTDRQFGFRVRRNTEDAVCDLSNYVSDNLDHGVDVIGLFIDVSKAFDSLSHETLLDKLYCLGFRGVIHSWLSSYLSDRFQYVSNGAKSSGLRLITSGVPQGSILGPLLFLLYVNDLPNVSDLTKFILFADDTTCLIPCPPKTDVGILVEHECSHIADWFLVNRLSINVKKCNVIFFTLKNLNSVFIPEVVFDSHVITCVSSVKFLGCFVDFRLNWHEHINNVAMRMCKGIAMLRFVHNSFPIYVKKMIYFAYIYPYMAYCLPAWGGTHKTYLTRLQLLQKKAIRLICNAPYLAHVAPLARCNQLLLFDDVYLTKMAKLMHAIIYEGASVKYMLSPGFLVRKNIRVNLRNSLLDLSVSYVRTSCRKRSVFICGINVWNNLPNVFKGEPNVKKFVLTLSDSLLSLYQ
jgi:hypothetical protein